MHHPILLALTASSLLAQAPKNQVPKEAVEAQAVRQALVEVLDAADNSWFGKPYQGVNGLDLEGRLNITLKASAINAKVATATGGAVKSATRQPGQFNLQMKGTYLAQGDFRTELAGDGGQLVYTRVATKGYLYSKALNAYHTRVDLPAADAPLTYLGWFNQLVKEVKMAYVDGKGYKLSFGKPAGNLETVIFHTATGTWDPKKREQKLDDTLDFWKRGHLEVTYDKQSKVPQRAFFENVAQGVRATLNFTYGSNGRLQSISVENQSRGFEGPGNLRVVYGGDGLMQSIAGELNAKSGRVAWDLNMSWGKGKKIAYMPPPVTAERKGKEDLQALLFVGTAGQIMDLQRQGLNLRSVALPK